VSAFTLIELILVMVLLATLLAVSAPALSRSFKGHTLEQETLRVLAATEYARSEAVSQSVPMVLWVNLEEKSFGVRAKEGFTGNPAREKSWTLPEDIHFEVTGALPDTEGRMVAVTFDPEGMLNPESVETIELIHRNEDNFSLKKTEDGWEYEIVTEL